ncbi:MAG: response regulator transcription factor [Planctomycetaceae bacterium]
MSRQTILVIEDEEGVIDTLVYNLEKEGFEVFAADDGASGIEKAKAIIPDLVLLDLMMPGMDGYQVCRKLRDNAATEHIKILMLTARSEESDEIIGFNMGADDYVTKPFKMKPLIHRIRALLRRNGGRKTRSDVVSAGPVTLDNLQRRVTLDDVDLDLTPTEFLILWTLVSQPGRVFSRHELLDTSRGRDANALDRTIDVHVRSLRKKMGDQSNLIETVRSVGYRFKRSA